MIKSGTTLQFLENRKVYTENPQPRSTFIDYRNISVIYYCVQLALTCWIKAQTSDTSELVSLSDTFELQSGCIFCCMVFFEFPFDISLIKCHWENIQNYIVWLLSTSVRRSADLAKAASTGPAFEPPLLVLGGPSAAPNSGETSCPACETLHPAEGTHRGDT